LASRTLANNRLVCRNFRFVLSYREAPMWERASRSRDRSPQVEGFNFAPPPEFDRPGGV